MSETESLNRFHYEDISGRRVTVFYEKDGEPNEVSGKVTQMIDNLADAGPTYTGFYVVDEDDVDKTLLVRMTDRPTVSEAEEMDEFERAGALGDIVLGE